MQSGTGGKRLPFEAQGKHPAAVQRGRAEARPYGPAKAPPGLDKENKQIPRPPACGR